MMYAVSLGWAPCCPNKMRLPLTKENRSCILHIWAVSVIILKDLSAFWDLSAFERPWHRNSETILNPCASGREFGIYSLDGIRTVTSVVSKKNNTPGHESEKTPAVTCWVNEGDLEIKRMVERNNQCRFCLEVIFGERWYFTEILHCRRVEVFASTLKKKKQLCSGDRPCSFNGAAYVCWWGQVITDS